MNIRSAERDRDQPAAAAATFSADVHRLHCRAVRGGDTWRLRVRPQTGGLGAGAVVPAPEVPPVVTPPLLRPAARMRKIAPAPAALGSAPGPLSPLPGLSRLSSTSCRCLSEGMHSRSGPRRRTDNRYSTHVNLSFAISWESTTQPPLSGLTSPFTTLCGRARTRRRRLRAR